MGVYFVVEIGDGSLDVECHGIDEPGKSVMCSDHEWFGTQFRPERFGCHLCRFDEGESLRDLTWIAYKLSVDAPGGIRLMLPS